MQPPGACSGSARAYVHWNVLGALVNCGGGGRQRGRFELRFQRERARTDVSKFKAAHARGSCVSCRDPPPHLFDSTHIPRKSSSSPLARAEGDGPCRAGALRIRPSDADALLKTLSYTTATKATYYLDQGKHPYGEHCRLDTKPRRMTTRDIGGIGTGCL